MSVVIDIKGMEMPECCYRCWALDNSGDYPTCRITGETKGFFFRVREKRMDRCPLLEVTVHGDLIDRDLLLNDVDPEVWEDRGDYAIFGYSTKQILAQPAVISANKEEVKE